MMFESGSVDRGATEQKIIARVVSTMYSEVSGLNGKCVTFDDETTALENAALRSSGNC